jgi:acetyl-CoA C-acetyltransferase
MPDLRHPVIVGIAEAVLPSDDPRDPFEWLAEVVQAAGADSGAPAAIAECDLIGLIDVAAWKMAAPARRLARLVRAQPKRTFVSATGGNAGQAVLDEICRAVQSGESEIALVAGVERLGARIRAGRSGTHLPWVSDSDAGEPDPVLGSNRPGQSPEEEAAGAHMPLDIYPLLETARRHRLGLSVEAHTRWLASLIAQFSEVAAANPAAWHREILTPEGAFEITPRNRMISAPYRRCMVADIGVDQAAAVLVMSTAQADRLNVPADSRVYPVAGSQGNETFWFSRRESLDRSPALDGVAAALLAEAGTALGRPIDGEDIARFDLYSCFPIAVAMGANAFGIADPVAEARPLTLTGGLARFGGPASNYATHGLCAAARSCREAPSELVVSTGLGWYATKHAATLLTATPPQGTYRSVALPDRPEVEVEVLAPANAPGNTLRATVEASTAIFHRDGTPERVLIAARTPSGARLLARSDDATLGKRIAEEAIEGLGVSVATVGDHFAIEDLQ